MNNEIKEILDYFRTYATIKEVNMIKKLYDYITNLQDENQKLKELVDCDDEQYDIQESIINRQKGDLLEKNKEIDRLNNIITKLENYIYQAWYYFDADTAEHHVSWHILMKLKELKGEEK